MEDEQIIALFMQRDETAIRETQEKYGGYCFSIANNILHNKEDAEECVNDTFNAAWNTIPPNCPQMLSTFLGKITRQISLKKLRGMTAAKRGNGCISEAFDELEELIPSEKSIDENIEAEELTESINAFLETLSDGERRVFLRRYWFFDSVKDISSRFGFSESKVKMMLKRTRDKLLVKLQKEGIYL